MVLTKNNTLSKFSNSFEKIYNLNLNMQEVTEIENFEISADKIFLMIENDHRLIIFDE
jgi:hypothetical protein